MAVVMATKRGAGKALTRAERRAAVREHAWAVKMELHLVPRWATR
jgi:hypothetical protein